MKFNYEHEKRVFEKEWMYIEKQCLEVGIAKDEIERVKADEWEAFRRERSFRYFTVHFKSNFNFITHIIHSPLQFDL